MQKQRLDLESVDVQSFATTPETTEMLNMGLRVGVTNTLCGPTCQGGSVCCETV